MSKTLANSSPRRLSSAQFGLRSLLVAILAVALMLASLRSSSMLWDLLIFNLMIALLAASLIGAALADRSRPFWLGFALVGWLHGVLCFGPWLCNYVGPHLLTTVATNYVALKLEPVLRRSTTPASSPPAQGSPMPSGGGGGFFWPGGLNGETSVPATGGVLGFQMGGMGRRGGGRSPVMDVGVGQYPGGSGREALPSPDFLRVMESSGSQISDNSLRSNFHRLCHYYTTLLVAWLSGLTCQILVARRDRRRARDGATAG